MARPIVYNGIEFESQASLARMLTKHCRQNESTVAKKISRLVNAGVRSFSKNDFASIHATNRPIVFIDGDCCAHQTLIEKCNAAFPTHEKHFTRAAHEHSNPVANPPKILPYLQVYGYKVTNVTYRKYARELSDKVMCAQIQKAIFNGQDNISIVTGDMDFYDVANFLIQMNPEFQGVFTIIISNYQLSCNYPESTDRIKIKTLDQVVHEAQQ